MVYLSADAFTNLVFYFCYGVFQFIVGCLERTSGEEANLFGENLSSVVGGIEAEQHNWADDSKQLKKNAFNQWASFAENAHGFNALDNHGNKLGSSLHRYKTLPLTQA